MKSLFTLMLIVFLCGKSFAQDYKIHQVQVPYEESPFEGKRDTQVYKIGNNLVLTYYKPKFTDIFVNAFRDLGNFGYLITRRQSLPWVAGAIGATAALIPADRFLIDNTRRGMNKLNIDSEKKYGDLLSIGGNSLLVYPQNFNSFLYWVGEGLPSLVIGATFCTYGLLKNDYRALQTATQLAEEFLSMGVTCQVIKHITGRQSPWRDKTGSGRWAWFPNQKKYMQNVSNYDAMPSGHMATMMCTVTILGENYPEKRWIKPVGYSIMAAVGLAMMHNQVHWFSDYPLAIGIGYCMGKIISNRGRKVSYTNKILNNLASRTSIYPTFINKNNFGVSLTYKL